MEYYYSIISIKIECRNLSETFKNKFVKKCLQLCKYVVSWYKLFLCIRIKLEIKSSYQVQPSNNKIRKLRRFQPIKIKVKI